MKKLLMYYQCWLEVTKQQWYWDKWLTDETYFQAIKAKFPMIIAVIVWIHPRDKDKASVVTGDMPLMGTGNAGEVVTPLPDASSTRIMEHWTSLLFRHSSTM
jgi:hypothetical protein